MASSTQHYPAVEPNPNFAKLEEEILKFWAESRAFETSVENRPANGDAYVFYDGPPFANGLPHYGHLLTGYVKDAIARYHTMRGKRVERRFGWDCHGLPAEMGAEKELGISGRAAIQGYGIDRFNEHCRTSVMKYTSEWEYYVKRQGRWVDFKNDYKTMDTPFMESVLWAFSELYKKGLVYESMRVMPYSWAAETPVSNFETRIDNATREREDKAAYVKFKLKPEVDPANAAGIFFEVDDVYLVAWTTTPWTLPSNLGLAVGDLEYARYETSNPKTKKRERFVAAKSYMPKLLKDLEAQGYLAVRVSDGLPLNDDSKLVFSSVNRDDLIGLAYEPLFPYFADTKNAFRVLDGGDAVTEGEGTGVVHMASGFGEVDQKICEANGIEVIVPVDEKGRFDERIYDIPWEKAGNTSPAGGGSEREAIRGGGSVHWQDFPDVSAINAEAELVADMDRVQDICNASLAIRNKLNIRVRQPLKSIRIATDTDIANQWRKKYGTLIADVIKDEVNVKWVEEGNMYVEDVATKKLTINSAVLGKRLPQKMKQILPASKKGEWEVSADGKITIAGEQLQKDEYQLSLDPKPEYADKAQPLSTNDALVILDTTITPELEAEGRARDVVRMVQQARKDSGLDVSDRIALALDVPPAFQSAIKAHADYIKEQTLAISIAEGKATSDKQITQELDGETFTIGISKAA